MGRWFDAAKSALLTTARKSRAGPFKGLLGKEMWAAKVVASKQIGFCLQRYVGRSLRGTACSGKCAVEVNSRIKLRGFAIFRGPVVQLGERYNGIVEVRGSTPLRSTNSLQIAD